MFSIKPMAGALGAELHGVNLCEDLSSETYAEIRRLLIQHQVIFFSGPRHQSSATQSSG